MISKTDFIQFIKHPALLWLTKNDRSKLPGVDDNLRQLFEDGQELEALAEARYATLARGVVPTLPGQVSAQCTFTWQDFECRVDLLEFEADGSLHLIEIKASSGPKPLHLFDLAFQRQVLLNNGLSVGKVSVMHVNTQYVRNGAVDPHGLLAITEVTAEVEAIDNIEELMFMARDVAFQAEMPRPSPRHSHKDFKGEWLDIARELAGLPETSIYDMPYLKLEDASLLEDQGILDIRDIPDEFLKRADQRKRKEELKLPGRDVRHDAIQEGLGSLQYPLYFLDYESVSLSVPAYDGTKPYQQVVFQYSLHVIEHPDAEPVHREYLHTDQALPIAALTAALRRDIGDTGTVIVWNQTFEKTRNKEMGMILPDAEEFYDDLNERIYDLMTPFKSGHYRDPGFKGSYSIKKVLPVLVPDLTYKELEVQEGQSASRLWRQIVLDGKDVNGRSIEILEALREYCKLDTYAMVAIYKTLASITSN